MSLMKTEQNMESENDVEIDLGKLFHELWKNKSIIVLVAVIFGLVGFAFTEFLITPKYTAQAQLYVNNRSSESSSSDVSSSDLQASSSLVQTYSVILKSHNMMEQIISDLDLDYTYSQLSDEISVESVNSTQVMQVSVTDESSQVALDIVSDLVNLAPDAITQSIDAGSVTVVDQPWTTGRPTSPNVRKNTIIATLIGFVLACLVIIIADLTNNKFRSTEDVKDVLGLSVLGVIPLENEETQKTNKKKANSKKTKSKKREGKR